MYERESVCVRESVVCGGGDCVCVCVKEREREKESSWKSPTETDRIYERICKEEEIINEKHNK